MSRLRVLATVHVEFGGEKPALSLLEKAGFDAVHEYAGPHWDDERTREKLAGCDAILAGNENFNAYTMEKADRLKIIARNGVGYDRVDLEACTDRKILVANTPGVMADAVADQAFALILALVRHIVPGDRNVKAGKYQVALGEDLAALCLGLLGCGRIGAEVARRAAGFKMRTLVYDPWVDTSIVAALGATSVSLDQLLEQAQVISLHTPLTNENQGMVNADFLARMRPGSYLINTARGKLVDENALIRALQRGHLAGAGLDCQASEPPQDLSLDLVRLDNVIAMPHSSSNTRAARKAMGIMAAQAIIDCLKGRVPAHVLNLEVLGG